jgi:hypothetical protein
MQIVHTTILLLRQYVNNSLQTYDSVHNLTIFSLSALKYI